MKFTVLGHACLYVEVDGVSLLIDPWLVGSCYWRSWWNFPMPDKAWIDEIEPDYIYITHLHWDHFHGPTLRRFDRKTHLLVPQAPTRRMVRDSKALGFKNISEIPHGGGFDLSDRFTLHSYQFGPAFIDSAAVVTDGDTVLLNANDCKLFGLPLRQITSRFKKFDFVFRSHSNASAIPYCIDGYERDFGEFRTKQDYVDEFARFCASVDAGYAIPFASNHCYLHRETRKFNALAVSPHEVDQYFNEFAAKHDLRTRCQIMPPGSSWDDQEGFSIRSFDYEDRDGYVDALLERYSATLERQYEIEERTVASFRSFQRYFRRFFATVPGIVVNRFRRRVLFRVIDRDGYKHWLLDFRTGAIKEAEPGQACDMTIEVHALVLNDCARKRMFSTWGPSKRLKIILHGNADHRTALTFLTLLDIYENDIFPVLTWRHLKVAARRWRELVEFLRLFVKYKLLRRPFSVKDLYPIQG